MKRITTPKKSIVFFLKSAVLFTLATCFLFLLTFSQSWGQTSITTTGQTGTSGTNWSSSLSGNTLTITTTGTATINQSVINNALNSWQNVVLVSNNRIDLASNVAISNTGSTAVRLTLKSIASIFVADNVSISSTNSPMDIILWTDFNKDSGTSSNNIDLGAGVTIDSKGGRIVLAGGLDDGSNNGASSDGIPDGYAYRGTSSNSPGLGGVNLGPSGGTGTVLSLLSQGGDITIRGRSRGSAIRPGIVSQANLKIDAGSGKIDIEGISSVSHGIEFAYGATPNIAINSSYAGVGPAIRIAGGTSQSTAGSMGLYLTNSSSGNILIQSTSTTGGGLLIQGTKQAGTTTRAMQLGNDGGSTNVQLLSAAGDIIVETAAIGILESGQGVIYNYGTLQYGSRLNSTAVQGITPGVTASNANIVFRGNNVVFDASKITNAATTGKFTVQPRTGDAGFVAATTFRNVDLSTVSEFIIGKVGNTQQVIVSTDISVNGPISIYGGSFENIQINANVKSTANGDILLRGENSTGWTARLNSTKTIEKTAGTGSLIVHGTGRIGMDGTILASGSAKLNVVLAAETDDGSTYGVSVKDITTNGGHVWIGGGSMVNTWNGLTVGTRWAASSSGGNNNAIDLGGNITTNGGDVLMSAWSGWFQDIAASAARTISTGTGDVTFLVRHASFGSNKITINSTGTFTLAPPSGQSFNATKVFNGTTASGIFTGSNNANPFIINNIANIKALHIGNYFGTGTVDDTPYDYKNIQVTDMNASLDINGPIVIYGAGVWVYGSLKTAAPSNPIQLIATGGTISIQGNLTTTTAKASILAKTTGNITSNASRTFQTNNGDFVLWADSDNANGGGISVGDNNTFNTANGSTVSELTGGGKIVLAGGADTNNDGIPDGVATGTHGVLLGLNTSNSTTMYSGGGDIILRGKSAVTSGRGIYQVGKLEANAGNGAIDFFGESSVFFGIDFNAALSTNKQLILTSNKVSGTAISITGTSGGNYGVLFNNNAPKEVLATGGGNIDIVGTAAVANTGVFLQDVDILATAGTITLNGGVRGTNFTDRGARFGAKAGSAITNSTANIRLISDANTFNLLSTGYTNNFNTSGTVTIEPFSNSFTSALTFPITRLTVANTVSGLTLGKSTNTANITFGGATSIAGPITAYGGTITLGANLTTTNGGDVFLYSDNALSLSTARSITAAGSFNYIPRGTSFVSAVTFPITNLSVTSAGLTIGKDGNTSNVTIGGATTSAGPVNLFGNSLEINAALTATNSNINLTASTAVTQSAAITANGLGLSGAGTFTLTNSANNIATIAGGSAAAKIGSLSLVDASGGLEIGTVNPTGITSAGPIKIETLEGNITLSQNLATDDATTDAIILNAGKNAAIGTATGGDIIVSGSPTLTMGSGGIAKLFSGSEEGSTGLVGLVGSSNVRYEVDETTTTFTPALATNNKYALFRDNLPFNISIVSSGGAAKGSGWNVVNGVLTVTASVSIDAAAILSELASGALVIQTNGTLSIDGALNYTGNNALTLEAPTIEFNAATSSAGDIILKSDDAVTQTGTGTLSASKLGVIGTASVTLTNANNEIGAVALGDNTNKVGTVNIVNKIALTVGTVNPTGVTSSGVIELATMSGDLLITEPLVSTLATGDAVKLYADKDAAAGAAGDGNIKISGNGSITIESGARALMYSGSAALSTGLSDLATEANTRTNVDATTATGDITPAIAATGKYALYRTVTLSNNADLANLTLSTGTLNPVFASATLVYNVTVPASTSAYSFTPTLSDGGAALTVNTVAHTSGTAFSTTLISNSTTFSITVVSSDGTVTKTYILRILKEVAEVPAPTGTWVKLFYGANFDPNDDQQATADTDIVGNIDNPLMQSQQQMVNVGGTLQKVYYFRVRLANAIRNNGAAPSTSFYYGFDITNDQKINLFVEANVKASTPVVAYHVGDPRMDGSGPSKTSWLNSSRNIDIERPLNIANSRISYYPVTLETGTTTNVDLDAPVGGSNTGNDTWLEFAFTESSFTSFTNDAYGAPGKKGNEVYGLVAFTSTSQTANGDIGGVNDKTADLTKTWAELGVILTSSLDAVTDDEIKDPLTVDIINEKSINGDARVFGVWNGDDYPNALLTVTVYEPGTTTVKETFVYNNGTQVATGAISTTGFSWYIDVTGYAPGLYPITAVMSDSNASPSTGSADGTLLITQVKIDELITDDTTPTITGITDQVAPADPVTVTLELKDTDGTLLGTYTTQTKPDGTWEITIPDEDALSIGDYQVFAEVTVGNSTSNDQIVLQIVNTPSIDITSSLEQIYGSTALSGTTDQPVNTDVDVVLTAVDGTEYKLTVKTNADGNWSFDLSTLPTGEYQVYVSVEDENGIRVSDQGVLVINQKELIIAGLTPQNKIYDGTNAVTVTGTASLSGVVTGSTVSLTGTAVHAFASEDVANAISVSTAGLSLTGADAANYTLTLPSLTADITEAPITITAASQSKVYDGNALINSGSSITNGALVSGHTYTVTVTGSQTNVGTSANIASAAVILDGTTDKTSNYAITYVDGALTITKATITGITFVDGSFVFDETAKSLAITGTLPTGTSVAYTDNARTAVGTQTVTATITGDNYTTLVLTAELTITKATITGITFVDGSFVYDGTAKSLAITGTLPTGTSVAYTNNTRTDVGTQTVTATITGGNYDDLVLTADLTITKATITGITFVDGSFVFDETAKSLAITGTLPGGTSVAYTDNARTAVGTQTVTATIIGDNYTTLVLTAELTITKATITGITFVDGSFVFDETAKSLAITGTLPTGTSVAYTDNARTAVGIQTVTATIIGDNYTTLVLTADLTITKATITGITFVDGSFVFDETAKSLAITGTLPGGTSVAYTNNTRTAVGAQTVTATITGGNYDDLVLTADLEITAKSLTSTGITFAEIEDAFYSGLPNTPQPVVKDGAGILVLDVDYTLSYSNNTDGGTASVLISGIGNYNDTKSVTFVINKVVLTVTAENKSKVFGDTDPSLTLSYDGFVNNETETVLGGTLVLARVAGESAGKYVITASGYTSTNYEITYVSGEFVINPKAINNADITVSTINDLVYNGENQTPKPVITDGAKTLVEGVDYTLTFTSNKDAGIATVKIIGLGDYEGNRESTFNIIPAVMTLTPTGGLTKVYGAIDPEFTFTFLGNVQGQTPSFGGTLTREGGQNVGNYKITAGSINMLDNGTFKAANYNLIVTENIEMTITKAMLTVIVNDDSKFVTKADVSGYAGIGYEGFVFGEDKSVVNETSLLVSRSNNTVEGAGEYPGVLGASGLSAANYDFSYQAGDFTIVAADQLLVKVTDLEVIYGQPYSYQITSAQYLSSANQQVVDLTNNATVNNGKVTITDGADGTALFDLAAVDPSFSSSSRLEVGSYKIDAINIVETSDNFSNAMVIQGNLTVKPKELIASVSGGISKVYDGNAQMTGLELSLATPFGGDQVNINATGVFNSPNAGIQSYTVSDLLLKGADAANYYVTGGANASLTGVDGEIAKRMLVLTPDSNQGKIFGETDAAITHTVSGILNGQTAAFTGLLGRDAGEIPGRYDILIGTMAMASNGAFLPANYELAFTEEVVYTINKKSIAASDITVASIGAVIYTGQDHLPEPAVKDGTNALVEGIDFTYSYSENREAGTATVTINGLGAYSGFRTITFTINPAVLTLNPTAGLTKVYGDIDPALVYTSTGNVSGEIPGFSGSLSRESGENVGNYKITAGAIGIIDNASFKASNYTLSFTGNVTMAITKAVLTVNANDDSKFVTQFDALNFAGITYAGFKFGETRAVIDASNLTIARSNAGVENAGVYSDVLAASGLVSGNYSFAYQTGDYTIVPADQLVVELVDVETIYGETATYTVKSARYVTGGNSTIDLTSSATISDGQVTIVDGASGTASFDIALISPVLSTAGKLAVGSYDLVGNNITKTSSNFSNTIAVQGIHTVIPKELTVSVTSSKTKVYDGNAQLPAMELTLASPFVNDKVKVSGTGEYASANAGNQSFTVSGMVLSGDDAVNYFIAGGAAALVQGTDGVVTKRELLITPQSNQAKIYGTVDPVLTFDYSGNVNEEVPGFTGALSRDAGEVQGFYDILLGSLATANKEKFLKANYEVVFTEGISFEIIRKNLATEEISLSEITDRTYSGESQAPKPIIKDGNQVLVEGVDYEVTYTNNTDAGTATVTIKGIGNYSGERTMTFEIKPRELVITPDTELSKVYGSADPELTYTYSGNVAGEIPDFTGKLSREMGENAGHYQINGGSLSIVDKEGFKIGNYVLKIVVGVDMSIDKASLIVKVNPDSKFVTKSDLTGYAGISYDGFEFGENSSILDESNLRITRTNAGIEAAGVYENVLSASGLASGNYIFTYEKADFTIVGADQLLVKIANVESTYGDVPVYGLASAQYLASSDFEVVDLTSTTTIAANNVTVVDGASGSAIFDILELATGVSTSNKLKVGTYLLDAENIVETSPNFKNTLVLQGIHTVIPKVLTVNVSSSKTKIYDGNAIMPDLELALATPFDLDVVSVSGTGLFASKNSGIQDYAVRGLVLSGADSENYFVTGGAIASITGTDGEIAKRELTLTPDAGQRKTFGEIDPLLTYVFAGNLTSEIPGFAGRLSRESGESKGTYLIQLGTLRLVNKEAFLSGNYELVFKTGQIFTIENKSISSSDITINPIPAGIYSGMAQTPAPIVKDGLKTLVEGVDYTVSYSQNIDAGTATATITGIGGYSDVRTVTFAINKKIVTVTADKNQGKERLASDPVLTFDIDSPLIQGNEFAGALVRLAGEAPGTYAISIGTLDAGSNYTIEFVSDLFTIQDTTSPTLDSTAGIDKDPNTGQLTQVITLPEGAQEVETFSANESVVWSLEKAGAKDDTSLFELTVNNDGSVTLKFKSPSTPGTYRVSVCATDQSGNKTCVLVTITVTDDTAPVLDSTKGIVKDPNTGQSVTSVTLQEGELEVGTFSGDKSVIWTLEVTGDRNDTGLFEMISNGNGNVTVRFKDKLDPGIYVVNLCATDASGNKSCVKITVLVKGQIALVIPTDWIEIAWGSSTSIPREQEVMTTEGNAFKLLVAVDESILNRFRRGDYLLSGTFTLPVYFENSKDLKADIRVRVLPKPAPQDILLSNNTFEGTKNNQEIAIGTLTVVDTIDNRHVLGLPHGMEDNRYFKVINDVLYWSSDDPAAGKTTFKVVVRVTDRDGNTLDKMLEINRVRKRIEDIVIYNTFTPQGDGINDNWGVPEIRYYKGARIQVFERSGKRVFYTEDADIRWDGTFNGIEMPVGSYYWVLEVRETNTVRKGIVNLLRK